MHTQFLTDIKTRNMDFIKGASDKHVDKVIDKAAVVAKEKVGAMIGVDKKKAGGAGGAGGAKDPKAGEGIGDMLSGAVGKAATDAAAEQALAFGKGLLK